MCEAAYADGSRAVQQTVLTHHALDSAKLCRATVVWCQLIGRAATEAAPALVRAAAARPLPLHSTRRAPLRPP
jgi:hypothetical protein